MPERDFIHVERQKIYKPHSEEEANFVYSDSPRYALLKGGEGAGKALALDTPLPTPTGWTTMGEVKVGDYLLDEEGKPCLVLATSEVMNDHKCYEVIFNDGRSIVADAEHLWLTSRLLTTQEILDTLKENHSIKLPSGEFRFITEVKEHDSVDVKCVMVNSSSHLYLAGDGMIPTHNSVAGIIKDLDRVRRGMSGILCCVAGDTMINGIPIAERTQPGIVDTLYGPAWASTSFCEGQADLFRVVTQLGHEVTVTASHRFLTPLGWRQLADLHVGNAIAFDDTWNEQSDFQTRLNFQDDYLLGLHPHDESSILLGQHGLNIQQQLEGLNFGLYPTFENHCHVCIDHSLDLPYWVLDEQEYCLTSVNDETDYLKYDAFSEFLPKGFYLNNPEKYLLYSIQQTVDSGERVESNHVPLPQELLEHWNNLQYLEFPEHFFLPHKEEVFDCGQTFQGNFSYNNYISKVRFVQIERISFQRYGEFYDLTVPSVSHYSAHGLFHHNSPDLPHFKRSLWPEFRNWCPPEWVIESQRYRLKKSWQPHEMFELVFINGTSLLCGGIERPSSWEGPNRSFWHLDEGRHADAEALKVLDGRCRIPGPNNEPPQGYITTTPKKNWLYEYFGPMQDNDKYAMFKNNSLVVTLPLELNKENLSDGFVEIRRASLTASEARVRVDADWEDESDTEKFINIFWWEACMEQLPPLTRSEPAVLSLDAATGSETTSNLCDCFAVVLVTRHPSNKQNVAIRYCGLWQAEPGKFLSFEPIEQEIIKLIQNYSIIEMTYDITQLHDMAMRLRTHYKVNAKPFDQGKDRLVADKLLQTRIMERRIAHDGNPLLKMHMDNADIKKAGTDGIRIVKRTSSLKIDAAVATSQAVSRILYYNLG